MRRKHLNLTGLCAVFLMATGLHASSPVKLTIEDNASLFSEKAREEAKAKLLRLSAAADRQVHIETYRALPEDKAKLLAEAKGDKTREDAFWHDWTMAHVKGDRGLVVLINWEPGKVVVKADRAVSEAGFTTNAASDLRERLSKALGLAKKTANDLERNKLLDEALAGGVSFIATTLPLERNRGGARRPAMVDHEGDNGLLGYVCLGLVGLMVVWMVVGMIRGSSAAPSMAPAGGGGFFSSLLGGMFGAAAGMWMYNSFFGSGSAFGNTGWGSDSSGGDESGAGDFSSGSESSGDFGGGDTGGDYGGGDF